MGSSSLTSGRKAYKMLDSVRSPRASLPPPATSRRLSRAASAASTATSARASRYSRAPSISATARYNDDYDQAGRRAKMEDARITPGSYSYMSLRARTPSVERIPDTSNKQLRFPRSNLPSTKNLTLLIKSQESRTKTKHHEDYLPVEVVAVGGKPGKQSERQPAGDLWPENYTYTSKINQATTSYNSDTSFSQYFLQNNKRLGDMIRRVQNY